MRIYLDNCCYNRPYDSTDQLSVELEARAKLAIQGAIRDGKYELVSSEVLSYEIHNHPVEMIRNAIFSFVEETAKYHVGMDSFDQIEKDAKTIMGQGIHYKDACHIASAIFAGCAYFLTTDKRLVKFRSERIQMRNPIDFLREMEDLDHA